MPTPSPRPAAGIADAVWDLFASIRLTIVLLLTLAATSMVGSVLPQNEDPARFFNLLLNLIGALPGIDATAWVSTYGGALYRFFEILGFFDLYHAWWFQLLLLLLCVNIIVCSADRISKQRSLLLGPRPPFQAARFDRLPGRVEFDDDRSVEVLQPLVAAYLGRKTRSLQVEPSAEAAVFFAENGRWTRWGVYTVHLSVVLLLVGGLIGSMFGFDGFVNIPEGETVQVVQLRGGGERLRLPFAIRCDDFSVSFYETGAPKEFRSRLTLIEDGRPVVQRDILVNDPLRHRGISIFQSSYGTLPAQEAVLSFTSRRTGLVYTREARLGQEIVIPEDLGTFTLTEVRHNAQFRGHAVGDAFVGRLEPRGGPAEEVILPLRFPTFDRMRRGEVVIAVEEVAERHYTGLQVNKDPGVVVVYIGFVLMILGCYVTFFTAHQQVGVRLERRGDRTRVAVSGTANKNKSALERRLQQLAADLRQLKG